MRCGPNAGITSMKAHRYHWDVFEALSHRPLAADWGALVVDIALVIAGGVAVMHAWTWLSLLWL